MVKKASTRSKSTIKHRSLSSPIVAIFQWLSYAFWGWVAIATATLVGISAGYVFNGYSSEYESVAYVIAAILVLLPIALVTDVIFSRNEKGEKSTAAMIIMVVHAVLFALIAVGALATLVFSLVSLVIGDGSNLNGVLVSVIAAGTVAVLFGTLTFRIMRPAIGTPLRTIIRLFLTVAVIGAMIWGIAGPVTQTILRRDDDRAVRALQSLQNMVASHVVRTGELPVTDAQLYNAGPLFLTEDEIELVRDARENELISYTPNIRAATTLTPEGETEPQTTYYYELCVTFEYEDENRNARGAGYGIPDSAGFSETLTTLDSSAGEQCFQLKQMTTEFGR